MLVLRTRLATTYRLLVLAECGMDYAAVEQNLGCVGDLLKDLESNVEFVVVVAGEGCHPGLDFLPHYVSG